jgi:SPP1 family predicted phage head-tail adaptor
VIRISSLRRRLTLEAPAAADDGFGGRTITWSAVATLWASVEPRGGSERSDADAVAAKLTHRVTLRHRSGVSPTMRFTDGDRTLDIRAVFDPDGRRRRLVCLCEERVPA